MNTETRGEKTQRQIVGHYDDYSKELMAKLTSEWRLNDFFDPETIEAFEEVLKNSLRGELLKTWELMGFAEDVTVLHACIDDAKKKGMTDRDNRPMSETPFESTRAIRIANMQKKCEILRNQIEYDQKHLQRKYVTIQTMRDRMDIIAKMREECYKFINDSVAREKAMNIEYCDLLDKMNPSEGEI